MQTQKFNILCEDLAKLASDVSKLELFNATQKERLNQIARDAESQHFKITLLSPFQCGKSTFFNTLCGGRELSPTGFGLETSATVVEARYIDSKSEEYATIDWYSNEELLSIIIETIVPHIRDLESQPSKEKEIIWLN